MAGRKVKDTGDMRTCGVSCLYCPGPETWLDTLCAKGSPGEGPLGVPDGPSQCRTEGHAERGSRGKQASLRRAGTMSAEPANGPTEDQVEILEYNFNKVNRHPDPTTLCLIAAEAGLSEEETQKWFKQRLAQWRRSEGLPSECRSVTD
uniref:Homeodomain-only protein n=1 Tax=Sus scrofa TaxID=9823 RepID=A0A8D1WFX3_PIG